jgi:hypothetical protein
MNDGALTQKTRFIILLAEVAILCVGSYFAMGAIFPPGNEKGFWFYTALLGLVLGARLDTPFFARPADVILYAAPAAIALLLGSNWGAWNSGEKVAFSVALIYCVLAGALGAASILSQEVKSNRLQRLAHTARVLAETLGSPRLLFTVVVVFALYAFHRDSPQELGIIIATWVLTALISPLEGSVRLFRRIRRIWRPNIILDADGEAVAYQTPSLILVRQTLNSKTEPGGFLAIKDPIGKPRLALALDYVGRDEGILLRTLESTDVDIPAIIEQQLSSLPPHSAVAIGIDSDTAGVGILLKLKTSLVGIVATDTSIQTLFFEVVTHKSGLQEGRMVETKIGEQIVTYQVVNGLTKEEIVYQKNTFGYARAQAQKIGEWDPQGNRFRLAKWLPEPNSPVFLKAVDIFEPRADTIGHFPGTNYGVALRKENGQETGIQSLVTHNTAILGILGVGKSSLALELVERIIAEKIKVICLDLTNQYIKELSPYYDSENEEISIKKLNEVGAAGRSKVEQNVEEGGSVKSFSDAMRSILKEFLSAKTGWKLKIFNPAQFEVWRQDSKPYNKTASMASLTAAEITQIISEATLDVMIDQGMTDQARVCLVYEEAHSLIPEWNSAVAEGDRSAANGTARAILQGRKYGLGCLLITQRTANVTKTILNQCNTVFAMRTFDETGKEFLANYLGRDYANVLPSLEERHAVFFGRASACETPVLIRLNDRADFIRVFRKSGVPDAKGDGKPAQVTAIL